MYAIGDVFYRHLFGIDTWPQELPHLTRDSAM